MSSNNPEWTILTLKEYFEKILDERDKAIKSALDAAKEAVLVAERNAEKWRANANEWRGAMTDRELDFVRKSEFIEYKASTDKATALQKERVDKGEGRSTGLSQGWGFLVGGIGLLSALITMFYALSKLKQ